AIDDQPAAEEVGRRDAALDVVGSDDRVAPAARAELEVPDVRIALEQPQRHAVIGAVQVVGLGGLAYDRRQQEVGRNANQDRRDDDDDGGDLQPLFPGAAFLLFFRRLAGRRLFG